MFEPERLDRARELLERLRARNWRLATAESCTGGLVAGLFTEIAGSSDVVDRGFVTYSNEAKQAMLGVSGDVIRDQGAVSRQVAIEMARGALAHSMADVAVAITGVAGPGGGTPDKPVGHVQFACAVRGRPSIATLKQFGDQGRSQIRLMAVDQALAMIAEQLETEA